MTTSQHSSHFSLKDEPKPETVWEVVFAISIARIISYGICVDIGALSGWFVLVEKELLMNVLVLP